MEPSESTSAETRPLEEGVEREWEGLAERLGAPPFLRPAWFATFGRAFGQHPLRLACLRRDGRLAAALPLVRRRGSLEAPVNWHTPGYGVISEGAVTTTALAEHLVASRVGRLDLGFLIPGDPLAAALRIEAAARRRPMLERIVQRSPYIDLAGSWGDFEARMPGKRRANMRRRRRRLDEEGEVTVEQLDGAERLEATLAEAYAVEAAGWKGSGGTAIASRPETRRFYSELAHWAASRGWLRLWFLRIDGRALAFALCLVQGGVLYQLKIGFDPEARHFAPGTLLTREMLAAAFDEGLSRFELLGQDEPYKLEWTDAVHELTRLQLFGRTPGGLLSLAKWRVGRPLALRAREALRADQRSGRSG